mmetsp:Transcript_57021/g.123418  ORF Transcript_57021/g.123418 Transcript_57021/m.123418 type:complete len:273 (-) Transcript_57021:19-837(-)
MGFDAESSELYAKVASQHTHPDGPWPMMVNEVGKCGPSHLEVLDVASGTGEPGVRIAAKYDWASVTATDSSADMVAKAEVTAKDFPNMKVLLADAQKLPFPDESFDIVTCCYGYMFPEDKLKALSETLRVLKPGGKVIATTWDSVGTLEILRDVMTAVLKGESPPPPAMNPMSLSEPGLFKDLLIQAGFPAADIMQTQSTYPFNFGVDPDYQFKICTFLVKDKITEQNAWDVARDAFWKNIEKYSEKNSEGEMILPHNTFTLTVASKASLPK